MIMLVGRRTRCYQKSLMTAAVAPARVTAPKQVVKPPTPAPTVVTEEVLTIPMELADAAPLSPAMAAAKAEIHAQLLAHHTAQIDINNRAGIRRLLLQLTAQHFRAKPPSALATAAT